MRASLIEPLIVYSINNSYIVNGTDYKRLN